MSVHHEGLEHWLIFGERGSSSNAIVQKLVYDRMPTGFNDPADPSDFRRCELLLRAVPSLRLEFHRMAEISPRWAGLVNRWGEILEALNHEVPDWESPRASGAAPRAYALIRNPEVPA